MPNSHDFVVYVLKKSKNMRVLRLYECRCDLHQSHYESVLKKDNSKNGYKEKIGQENLTIMRMIKGQKIKDMPLELFSEDKRRCKKVYSNLTKFYAHLRTHTKEKPFECPLDTCRIAFS